ncbi:hypothetical protein SV7mr_35730 [Stieleria bergensis]|uniref:Uncharacterized protein n=1 Tax=Stieleria bergensis TaxID=2528025 RepID=A0A517SYA9_9BACT|nr:hypothetical protein SV7mr_35730 [Planctomycetes bacterium SV_7m_r]
MISGRFGNEPAFFNASVAGPILSTEPQRRPNAPSALLRTLPRPLRTVCWRILLGTLLAAPAQGGKQGACDNPGKDSPIAA